MRSLASPNPAHIAAIPGLYISDILIPASGPNLKDHGITHVLTILNNPLRPPIPTELGIAHEYIEIDDDPLADLLEHLEHACSFISGALNSPVPVPAPPMNPGGQEPAEPQELREPRVLIHCLQGVSRSGSLVVAYLMRSLSLSYPAALDLARTYRDVITPNEGFAAQLEMWGRMGCSILNEEGGEKAQYVAWKKGRERRMARLGEEGRNRERVRGMASMAAKFGARREEMMKNREGVGGGVGGGL